jgi:CBS domain-containing protein
VVINNGRTAGLVTPAEVRQVDREQWRHTSVQAIMKPLDRIHAVTPETPVLRAMRIMAREDVNQLPVISHGQFDGIVTRAHILQLLHSRAELGA